MKPSELKFLLVFFLLFGISEFATAQFHNLIGTGNHDVAKVSVLGFDGNYLVMGNTGGLSSGRNIFLSKIDPDGNIIWTKTYGGSGDEEVNNLIRTKDNNYLFVGHTSSSGSGSTDGWMVKIDTSGGIIWSNTVGGSGADHFKAVIQTSDSSFLVSGTLGISNGNFWLNKFDKNGNRIWHFHKGGNATDYGSFPMELPNGNYFISFYTNGISGGYGQYDVNAMIVDTSSNVISMWKYGTGIHEGMRHLVGTHDGNILLIGTQSTSTTDKGFLIMVDTGADMLVGKLYEASGAARVEFYFGAYSYQDSGFVVVGFIDSDAAIIKLDKSLNVVWSRKYAASNSQFSWNIIPVEGNQFLWTGYTDESNGLGNRDAFIIKTDSLGYFNCNPVNGGVSVASGSVSHGTLSSLSGGNTGTTNTYSTSPSGATLSTLDRTKDATNMPLNLYNNGTPVYYCTGDSVKVDATSDATEWLWSNGKTTSHVWVGEPDTLHVRASNSYCFNEDSVIVLPRDSLKLRHSEDTLICNADTFKYSVYASGGLSAKYSFQWKDSATNQILSHGSAFSRVLTSPLTLNILVWDSCSNYRDSGYFRVRFFQPPQIQVPDDTVVCEGEWAQFYASGTGGDSTAYQYSWLNGQSTGDTLLMQFDTTKSILVTLNDGCNLHADSGVFVVITRPELAVTLNSDTTICVGETVSIRAVGSGGDTSYTYTWNQGLGSGSDKTVSPVSTTTYRVYLSDDCSATEDSADIEVTVRPELAVTTLPDTTVCQGEVFTLYASGSGGLTGSYLFSWNAGLDTGRSQQVSFEESTLLRVVLSDGCTADPDTATVRVYVRDSLQLTLTRDTLLCLGQSITLTANAAGGNPGTYSYQWDQGLGTGNQKTVTPDTTMIYRVVLSDNCSKTPDTAWVKVSTRPPLEVTLRSDTTICRGENVILYSTGDGGDSLNYTFTWNQGVGTGANPSVSPAQTTQYRLILSDNCTEDSDTAWVTIHVRDPLHITLNPDTTICVGEFAQLRASASGGLVSGYTYSWSPTLSPDSVHTVNPVVTTQYRVILTDNCSSDPDTAWINLTVRDPLSVNPRSDTTICLGESFSLFATGSGGYTPGYIFSWNNGLGNGVSHTIAPVSSGVYQVILRDNCTVEADTAEVTVSVRQALSVTPRTDTVICIGENVLLWATPEGGYSPQYELIWDQSVGTGNYLSVQPESSTQYRVVLRDDCSADPDTAWVTIQVRSPLNLEIRSDSILCVGESIDLFAAGTGGDSTNYQFSWDHSVGIGPVHTVTPDTTTLYTVVLSDGCTFKNDTARVLITVRPPLDQQVRGDTFICIGEYVRLHSEGSGGYAPAYVFQWDHGLDTGQANQVNPTVTTTYQVVLSDGCTSDPDTARVTVFVRGPLVLIKRSDTLICRGEEVELYFDGTGGDSLHYTFIWDHDAGIGNYRKVNPDTTIRYTVFLKDNCTLESGIDSVLIEVRPPLSIVPRMDTTICVGETVTLYSDPSGGYAPGYDMSWDQGIGATDTPVVAPAFTTTYQVILRDHCTVEPDTASLTVLVRDPIQTIPRPDTLICVGETVNLYASASGGDSSRYVFNWSGGLDTGQGNLVSPHVSTVYQVIVSDNCTLLEDTAELTIRVREPLAVDPRPDSTICIGQSIRLYAGGRGGDSSYYFRWGPGLGQADSPVVAPGMTTTYQVILYDDCTLNPDTSSMTVFVRDPLLVEAREDTTICIGQEVLLWADAAGGDSNAYEFNWEPGAHFGEYVSVSPSVTTDYLVTLRDQCTSLEDTSWVRISVRDPLVLMPRTDTFICIGESVYLYGMPSGGYAGTYNYRWDHGLGNASVVSVSPDMNTTYQLILNDQCTEDEDTTWMTVYVRQPLNLQVREDSFICQGESIILYANASGGDSSAYEFTWNQGIGVADNPVVSPTVNTTYLVTLRDNCTTLEDTASVTISLPVPLSLSTSNDTLVCREVPVMLSASGEGGLPHQYVYNWTGLGTGEFKTVYPLFTTKYSVTLSDQCAIPVSDTVTVNVQVPLVPGFTFDPAWACLPNEVDFTDTTVAPVGTWYLWEYGDGNRDTGTDLRQVQHSFQTTGSYQVHIEVRSPLGCPDTSYTIIYEVHEDPVAAFSYQYDKSAGHDMGIAFINETIDAVDYHWNYGDLQEDYFIEHPIHGYAEPGRYRVTLTAVNEWGCIDSVFDTVEVKDILRVWVPSAFTPSMNDTLNTSFGPIGTGIGHYQMEIYDRWGALVYRTNSGVPWNGLDSEGNPSPSGVYLYVILTNGERGGKQTMKGTVTLLR